MGPPIGVPGPIALMPRAKWTSYTGRCDRLHHAHAKQRKLQASEGITCEFSIPRKVLEFANHGDAAEPRATPDENDDSSSFSDGNSEGEKGSKASDSESEASVLGTEDETKETG